MTPDFEKDNFLSLKRLSANSHYYNEVFKRTERIASVVFYVLSYIEAQPQTQVHHQNLTDKAMQLHEAVIATLNLHEYETKDGLSDFVQAIVALESAVRLAAAGRFFTNDVERVLTDEIDILLRVVRNHYIAAADAPAERHISRPTAPRSSTKRDTISPPNTPSRISDASDAQERSASPRSRPLRAPRGDMSSQAATVYGPGPARTERIKTVLEAKGEATIKDIAEVITDCSEKTIQRDLNALIEAGEVERHGERRWSRYTVVKS